jgi:NTF2 fold immunity protein
MSEMNVWEVKFHSLYKRENGGPEAHQQSARNELVSIYEKYVTPKDRKTGRLAGPSAGYPPEFDVQAEKVEKVIELSATKVTIETTWTHPVVPTMMEKRRYTLVKTNGAWRIDKKEIYRKIKDAWENRVL